MTFKLLDRTRMSVSGTPGTGVITVGAAALGFLAFGAGLSNGDTTSYLIEDGTPQGSVWEYGIGTWSSSGTFTRTTINQSSLGGATAISATSAAMLSASLRAEDLVPPTPVPTSTTPAIVQSGYVINHSSGAQSITLGSTPTPGNLMVLIGFGGGQVVGSAYSSGLYGVGGSPDVHQSWELSTAGNIGYSMHVVRASEGATYGVGVGDPASTIPFGAVLIEVSGVDVGRCGEFLMSRGFIPTGSVATPVNVLAVPNALILGVVAGDSALSMSGLTSVINQTNGSARIILGDATAAGGYGGLVAYCVTGVVEALIMALPGAL